MAGPIVIKFYSPVNEGSIGGYQEAGAARNAHAHYAPRGSRARMGILRTRSVSSCSRTERKSSRSRPVA